MHSLWWEAPQLKAQLELDVLQWLQQHTQPSADAEKQQLRLAEAAVEYAALVDDPETPIPIDIEAIQLEAAPFTHLRLQEKAE